MLFKSGLVTQISGSIGGMTGSHNRGGMYIRARTIPVNPGTTRQNTLRGIFASIVGAWGGILTAGQRAGWKFYDENVMLPNALGDPRHIGAMQQYIRSNVFRVQAGVLRVDDAPAIYNLGDFTEPSLASVTAPSAVSLGFDNTDAWANEDDAIMSVYTSSPQNPTIGYFKGPYQFAGRIDGDGTTPPTSPAAITAPQAYVAGQKVFVAGRVSRADGRLSTMFRLDDIVV